MAENTLCELLKNGVEGGKKMPPLLVHEHDTLQLFNVEQSEIRTEHPPSTFNVVQCFSFVFLIMAQLLPVNLFCLSLELL